MRLGTLITAAGALGFVLLRASKAKAAEPVVTQDAPVAGRAPPEINPTVSVRAAPVAGNQPRGIRNHNPGNVRSDGRTQWQGMIGVDDQQYIIFRDAVWGIRAMARDLITGFVRDDEDTIREIITEYAPAVENNTRAYIESVSRRTGFGPDESIPFEPHNLEALVAAIIFHENGQQPYSRELIADGVRRAL